MRATRVGLILGLGLVALALALALPNQGASQTAPSKRTIYMAAVEPKGGTAVSSEPYPSGSPALTAGPGYVLRAPDGTGRWEVSTYQWQPSFVMANEGEDVTLEIIGINGAEHTSFIEGINVPAFNVKRGQISLVNFRAARAGFYRIVCSSHLPSMVGYLVVLPRR
jgi:plastocyanin